MVTQIYFHQYKFDEIITISSFTRNDSMKKTKHENKKQFENIVQENKT